MIYINETKGNDYRHKIKFYDLKLCFVSFFCIGLGVVFCILSTWGIVAYISSKSQGSLEVGVSFLLFGPMFILMGIYCKKIFRKTIEKTKQKIAPTTRVTFEENVFEVMIPFNVKKSGRYQYAEAKVTEYPRVWVIELSDEKWHTLNKSDMVEGSAEALSAFLAERLGERYTIDEEAIEETT